MRCLPILLLATVLAACGSDAATGPGPGSTPDAVTDGGIDAGPQPDGVCVPDCVGRQCGDDGCGASCGLCLDDDTCSQEGTCIPALCEPTCEGKQCGPDGCGGSCGGCPAGEGCKDGLCQGCIPDCDGKQCGDDGCGGSCGSCPDGVDCDGNWQCAQCTPDCAGKHCGTDGCGGSCGSCPATQLCTNAGGCVAQGGGCDSAVPIDVVPVTLPGLTQGKADGLSFSPGACPGEPGTAGLGSPDQVYQFTVPDYGTYVFTLSADFEAVLYVVADCALVDESCLGADVASGAEATLSLLLEAGATVSLVVDGAQADQAGSYTLDIHGEGCSPQCGGKTCGPDGCGGSCGSCPLDSDLCTATGLCVAAEGGCPSATVVTTAPWSTSGDTSDAADVLGYSAGQCPGETSGWGKGAPEQVFAFTPPSSGSYTVTLTAEYDSNLYVAGDCSDVDGSCLAASEEVGSNKIESVIVDLDDGVTTYIVVDGWGAGASGPFTLAIDPGGCAPSCNGKECGDDGCGGSCGSCAGSTPVCTDSGLCEAPPAPTCPDAILIGSLPYSDVGDTTDLTDELGYGDNACPGEITGWGDGAPEQVYGFTATAAGTYTATLTPEFDSNLYVIGDCEDVDGSCLAADDELGNGLVETLSFYLAAGESAFIVVDGWGASVSGAYTLAFAKGDCAPSCAPGSCANDGCGGVCGTCGPGDVCGADGLCVPVPGACASTISVGALPYSHAGDTTDLEDALGYAADTCPGELFTGWGDGAPEQVYAFTAPVTGLFDIALTPSDGFDSNLYVLDDCDAAEAACLGADEQVGKGKGEQLSLELEQAETVYIVVDGWGGDVAGAYTLDVDLASTCCEAEGTLGCAWGAGCQSCVCFDDPYCCETEWDVVCAGAANGACADTCGCQAGCVPSCGGKECGDDGCGGSCGQCGAGTVCSPSDTCLDPEAPCDDGNPCTFDIYIPEIGCQNAPVAVPGCSADIVVTSPVRGAMLSAPGSVVVSGHVTLPGGTITKVTINGETLSTSPATGAFSHVLQPTVGLNVIDIVAKSALGGERRAVRAFTYAEAYQPVGEMLSDGTRLYASGEVWDDDDTWDVDDVATVVTLMLEGVDFAQVLPDPLGSYKLGWCTYDITITDFDIGDPIVDLNPVDEALRAVITYPDLAVDLHAEGSSFGCISTDPVVTADSIQVALNLAFATQADGSVYAIMWNEAAVFENLDITLPGVAGFLFNWIVDFFEDDVAAAIEAEVVSQLAVLPDVLGQALQKIAINKAITVSLPLGPPTTIDLEAELSEIGFGDTGGTFDVATALVPWSLGTPYGDAPGSLRREGCGSTKWAPDIESEDGLSFGISDDVINQALFALWWSGGFEGSALGLAQGQFDLGDYGFSLQSLDVSFLLPPVVGDCGADGLVVAVGDVRIDADVAAFGQTLDLEAYASLVLTAQPVVTWEDGAPRVGIKVGQATLSGVEMGSVPEDMAGIEPMLQFVLMEHVLPPLLEKVTDKAFANYPIPEIPLDILLPSLPQGTTIALDLETVDRDQGYTILRGAVK